MRQNTETENENDNPVVDWKFCLGNPTIKTDHSVSNYADACRDKIPPIEFNPFHLLFHLSLLQSKTRLDALERSAV